MTTEDKIIASLTHMTENIDAATDVTQDGDEIYFRFRGHLFSMIQFHNQPEFGEFGFFIYPQWNQPIGNLIATFEHGLEDRITYAVFHSEKMDNPEAPSVMRRMYSALKSRALGVDGILDDVLRATVPST